MAMGKRKLMMNEDLPTDLILEIICRLPFKCIARCRCLSKLWAYLLTPASPCFTDLFLTHSKTQPRLLFAVMQEDRDWWLYSSPQPQFSYNSNEKLKPSLSVTAEFHISLQRRVLSSRDLSNPISGLIFCPGFGNYDRPMLCNPTTRQLFWLPHLRRGGTAGVSFLGYDPINKRLNILALGPPLRSGRPLSTSYQILNLESGRLSCRSLRPPLHHYPLRKSICINGVLYYLASFNTSFYPETIVSFDFNLQEFKFIQNPWPCEPTLLVNYKGKLGGINTVWVKYLELELSLWVLEDVEKQEWSEQVYHLPKMWGRKPPSISIMGVTATGEVVLSSGNITHPFYVYFYNIEKKSVQKVEIKGFEAFEKNSVRGWVDYVENINWNWS